MADPSPEQPDQPKKSFVERILVLHMNGWWPAFVVSFVLFAGLTMSAGAIVVMLGGMVMSLSLATLFSAAAGPFLGPWRASMGKRSFLMFSGLLSGSLIIWSILNLAFVWLAMMRAAGFAGGPDLELTTAVDTVIDELSVGGTALAWLTGLIVCAMGRDKLRGYPGWTYDSGPAWHKIVCLVLLAPYVGALLLLADVVWSGARVRTDLQATYAEDIARLKDHQGLTPEESLQLPETFAAAPVVAAWIKSGSATSDQWAKIMPLWRQQAKVLWTGAAPWQKPPLVALAKLAALRAVIERDEVTASDKADAAVRSEVVLIEHGGVSATHSQRLYELKLPAEDWERLVGLALGRTDLLQAASLTDDDVRERFVQAIADLQARPDYDLDGNLHRRFFQRCAERSRLNHLWQSYLDGRPYAQASEPLNGDKFRQRYASSLAFDLDAAEQDISQATFKEDLARQNLAYDIVLLELKRLEAQGSALPKSWSEFRPQVGAIGQAYSDWMVLTPTSQGVSLRRVNARRGTGLTHQFRKPKL